MYSSKSAQGGPRWTKSASHWIRIASDRVRIAFGLRPGASPNADLGTILGPTWLTRRLKHPILIYPFAILGFFNTSWLLFGASWQYLKPSLRYLGAILAASWPNFATKLDFYAKIEPTIFVRLVQFGVPKRAPKVAPNCRGGGS